MTQPSLPNEELLVQLEDLKQRFNALRQSFDLELDKRKSVEFALQERLKELSCHNQISELMANSMLSLTEVIEQIVQIIPPSWQFPEIAQAIVVVNDKTYQTPNYIKSRHFLHQSIKVNGKIIGYVEVSYPEDQIKETTKVFLPEETDLLFSIAVKIGNFIEKSEKDTAIYLNEKKYRTLVESISEIIYEFTLDGIIKYMSPAVERILGYKAEELIGKSVFDILYPEDRPLLAERLALLVIEPASLHEYRFLSKTGEICWMSKSTVNINKHDQQITRVGILRDVTEQKKSEEALLRANRLYAVISHINQAIVHFKDKSKLFEELCSVAVDHGEFRMAWIGIVDNNSERVIPFVSKGYDADYLSLIKPISLADCPEGNGPTGTALRNGNYFVCNDIESDPHMKPWKNEALKRGYRSSIALPIKQFGKVIASFNLYSSVPYFFNEEETKLLENIVGDIGFAFESIELDNERKKAEEETKKFRTIIDEANYGSALTTMDGTILYINQAFARMHQYEASEVIGKHISILHNKQQLSQVELSLKILAANGDFSALEIWHMRKDGSVFPTLMNASVIFDANHQPQYLSATAIDISEMMQKEEELRQSEESLNYAQELGNMGSWELDMRTNKLELSKNYYRMLGLDPADRNNIQKILTQRVHPDDIKLQQQILDEIRQTHKANSVDYRLTMPDGKTKWIQNNIVPVIEGGELVGIKGVNIDITAKKTAAEEIRLHNLKLNAIINAIPDLMFILDSAGTYLEFYSKHVEKLIAPVSSFIGKNLHDFFEKTAADFYIKNIQESINTGNLISFEYTIDNTEGRNFFEARLSPLDENKVLAFIRDITDKKQTEIQIKKLSQAVEQSPVLVVVTGLDGTIEYVNPAFTNVTGYSYEEAIGQNPRILQSGKTDSSVYSNLWNTIKQGNQWQGEWINKKKNGELFWEAVVITPIQNEQNVTTNYLAVKQDITQRKLAEEEIRNLNASLEKKIEERTAQLAEINLSLKKEIEERKIISEALQVKTNELENFFNVALDLLCIADTQGNFIRVNKAWENILGYSASDLEKRQFLEFVHPDDIQATLDTMAELSEQHPILNFTNRYLSKDGTYRFIEWRSTPSGQLIYAAARDITERIKAEEETQNARREAEQANLAKSEFLSRMSHELRTPMNAILGFAQLLEMGQLNPSQRKGVDHILRGGKHLLDLINEVLDISRIESGRLSLSVEPVRLHEVLEEMIDNISPLAEKRQVKVNLIDSPDNFSFVKTDRQRLKQVLLNLINNAIKYNRDQGNVNITTKVIYNQDKPVATRISVTDTGLGIHDDDLPKLFKPFERIGLEQTTTEGSGLGLAVVKKLVEAMNGKVGVESEYGVGSTFWIELPHTENQTKSLDGSENFGENLANTTDKTGTILYIEDNNSNIELIEQILNYQRPNIQLISHTNGKQAVSLCTDHKPDLILLDLNLPDIHGSEVLVLLQNQIETKDIPVVIISADAMPQQLNKLLKAGARNYLTKPLDIAEFLKVIDNFLPAVR